MRILLLTHFLGGKHLGGTEVSNPGYRAGFTGAGT